MIKFVLIFIILLIAELVYFKIADYFNIIDKPNQRSSHTNIVLRGGGIIFTIGLWIWSLWQLVQGAQGVQEVQFYPWLLAGVTLAAGISFVDDIHSLPDSVRLVVQFTAMFLVFQEIGLLHWDMWWVVPIALIVAVAGTNIFNFMDGINGITGGYSLAILIPLMLVNRSLGSSSTSLGMTEPFVDESMLIVVGLSVVVFCYFNFRTKGKAKCFAGDVGSIAGSVFTRIPLSS